MTAFHAKRITAVDARSRPRMENGTLGRSAGEQRSPCWQPGHSDPIRHGLRQRCQCGGEASRRRVDKAGADLARAGDSLAIPVLI